MSELQHYRSDTMREIMERSRDLIQAARILHKENPDITLISCIGLVIAALKDIDADMLRDDIRDIADAIDWLRKAQQ